MIKNLSKKIAIFFSIIISINFILYDDVYAYEVVLCQEKVQVKFG